MYNFIVAASRLLCVSKGGGGTLVINGMGISKNLGFPLDCHILLYFDGSINFHHEIQLT